MFITRRWLPRRRVRGRYRVRGELLLPSFLRFLEYGILMHLRLDREAVCVLLKKIFDDGLRCERPEVRVYSFPRVIMWGIQADMMLWIKKSFITPPVLSTRFASTTTYQFHELLPSLENLVTYIQQKFCSTGDKECYHRAELILAADSVDMNYDSISHALTVSGYWSQAPGAQGWTETIGKREAGTDQVEVGLLGAEQANDPEEIKMGGLLAAVGNDNELSKFFSPSAFKVPLIDSWFRACTFLIPITTSPAA